MTKTKCVIYCRVSSREQEETGYSLPSQEKFLKEYAERRDFKIAKKFLISESASGKYQRKTFAEMMRYSEKNNIKIIVCEKVDRLTRNFKDAVQIDEWLEKNEERQLHLVKDSLILHKNSRSQEKLNWGVRILFAKNYIDNLSEEVKKGQKEKLSQGWLPTKPPLGYKTIGEKGHKIHIVDKEKSNLVIKMFELYSTGNYSLKALAKTMYREGLRNNNGNKLIRSRIHELLSNPFYYGKNQWKGELHEGKQEHLISEELFNSVQEKLIRKTSNPQYKKHLPVFKAKIKCEECGGTITWEIQKSKWYGHCNHYKKCSQKGFTRKKTVEEQLFPYFDGVAPKNKQVLQWLTKALKKSHSNEIENNSNKREGLNRLIKRADQRMENAYRDKLDGKAPAYLCEKIMSEAETEKKDLLEALSKLSKSRKAYYEVGYAIHELACNAKDIYKSPKATVEEKRLLLSHVFSNLSLNAHKIRPNYTLGFEFLTEWIPKLNDNFEHLKNLENKGQKDAFASPSPVLLPLQDAFRTLNWINIKKDLGEMMVFG